MSVVFRGDSASAAIPLGAPLQPLPEENLWSLAEWDFLVGKLYVLLLNQLSV